MMRIARSAKAVLALCVCCGSPIQARAQAIEIAEPAANWRILSDPADPKGVCFAVTQPSATLPKGANRAPVYFYISTWPKDGVKSEISVKLGYPIKRGTQPALTIDAETFRLLTYGDRAYIADPTRELKAIEAMRKGSTMTVQAASERGTATTDTYSLTGFSQALQKLAAACP